jgi:Tfp pilus assembly protein PilF
LEKVITAQARYRAYYGLGEIAYRRKDRAKAIEYYQKYLEEVTQQTPEAEEVKTKLKEAEAMPSN